MRLVADELRARIVETLTRHTHLTIAAVDIVIDDVFLPERTTDEHRRPTLAEPDRPAAAGRRRDRRVRRAPAVESTVRAVAAELDWAESTGLVHVHRSAGIVAVTAKVATDLDGSTPEILARAAEALKARVEQGADDGDGGTGEGERVDGERTETLVTVTAHLVDLPSSHASV